MKSDEFCEEDFERDPPVRPQPTGRFGEPEGPPEPQIIVLDCGHWHDEKDGAATVANGRSYCDDCVRDGLITCANCGAEGASYDENAGEHWCAVCSKAGEQAAEGLS